MAESFFVENLLICCCDIFWMLHYWLNYIVESNISLEGWAVYYFIAILFYFHNPSPNHIDSEFIYH